MRQFALPKVRCSPGYQANQPQASPQRDLRRLALLFAISILVTFWLADGSATAEMLFQSPQSPVPEQQAPPAQPEQQPAQPQPTAPPVQQAPAEQQPVEAQQPVEQEPVQSEQTETDQSTTDEPAADGESLVEPAEETDSEPLVPEESASESEPFGPQPVDLGKDLFADDEAGSPNFILDRIELIDSVVVSTAYVWLCCGVLLFLLVPVFMLFLYLRGRSQIVREEGF